MREATEAIGEPTTRPGNRMYTAVTSPEPMGTHEHIIPMEHNALRDCAIGNPRQLRAPEGVIATDDNRQIDVVPV